jgi:hypothetical protein
VGPTNECPTPKSAPETRIVSVFRANTGNIALSPKEIIPSESTMGFGSFCKCLIKKNLEPNVTSANGVK